MMEENNNENIDKDLTQQNEDAVDSMFASLDDSQPQEDASLDLSSSLFGNTEQSTVSDVENDIESTFEEQEINVDESQNIQSEFENSTKEISQNYEQETTKPEPEVQKQKNIEEPLVNVVESTDDELLNQSGNSQEMVTVRPVRFQEFTAEAPNRSIKKNLDIMQDVSMHISVELGRTKSSIRDVMEMERGSIVELDKIAGEQVEIFVNEKLVAKGEVIVIEDKFGVRVTSTNVSKAED